MDAQGALTELRNSGTGAFFRPRDVEPLGISHYQIQRMVAQGSVERVDYGLYRLADVEATELETIVMVASAVPHAIICLLSALRIHDMTSQASHKVWLAIDRKARKPGRLPAAAAVVRFSGQMLTYGVESRRIQGVAVQVTSPARTVVDCFRYRNKIGLDVAMEALRDCIQSRKATIAEIDRAAEVCRIRTVIGPYLEALAV